MCSWNAFEHIYIQMKMSCKIFTYYYYIFSIVVFIVVAVFAIVLVIFGKY